jgi:HAD superfamily hydrolase (TIGR01509 family)
LSAVIAGLHTLHLQAVIFDMDGVLIDSHPAHRKAWRNFLRTLHREVCDDELDYILDGRKREDILRHFLGDISSEQLKVYGQQKDAFFQKQTRQVSAMPGLLGFLTHLRKMKILMAVATSASEMRTYCTLERLNLRNYFGTIITSNDVKVGKPAPAIYRLACSRLGISPDSAVAMEDAFSGIQAAKAAGLRCVAVPGNQDPLRLLAAGADLVIKDFRGLTLADLERGFSEAKTTLRMKGDNVADSSFRLSD